MRRPEIMRNSALMPVKCLHVRVMAILVPISTLKHIQNVCKADLFVVATSHAMKKLKRAQT